MRRIIYNDDSQGVHEARPGHARPDLEAWIDQALTLCRIDTYVWCICYPDIAMHRTRTGEVYGARFPEPPNAAAAVIAELHTEGTDVLEVVAARARNHGVEFIAGMRMNDTHGMYPDPNDPQMARFLIDHPEYMIARQAGIPQRAQSRHKALPILNLSRARGYPQASELRHVEVNPLPGTLDSTSSRANGSRGLSSRMTVRTFSTACPVGSTSVVSMACRTLTSLSNVAIS